MLVDILQMHLMALRYRWWLRETPSSQRIVIVVENCIPSSTNPDASFGMGILGGCDLYSHQFISLLFTPMAMRSLSTPIALMAYIKIRYIRP